MERTITIARIEKHIRHLQKRIPRLEKRAEKAYAKKHNIIAVDCLNLAYFCERKIEFWKGLRDANLSKVA